MSNQYDSNVNRNHKLLDIPFSEKNTYDELKLRRKIKITQFEGVCHNLPAVNFKKIDKEQINIDLEDYRKIKNICTKCIMLLFPVNVMMTTPIKKQEKLMMHTG